MNSPLTKPGPAIRLTAFCCPHCSVYTSQFWARAMGDRYRAASPLPVIPNFLEMAARKDEFEKDDKSRKAFEWAGRMASRLPFIDESTVHADYVLNNVFFSRCYDCSQIAIWVHDKMIYPGSRVGPAPDPNMPVEIQSDYEEAQSILDISPRGAAALLRLCVQKLCKVLGEKGDHIDTDIASLVRKGLDPMIQEALDAVRVIGNEAVHPGQMDLQDDRATADELFDAVNFIVDQTISRKKKLAALYEKLPLAKREAIDARNAKALAQQAGSKS